MTRRREQTSLFPKKNLKKAKTIKILSLFLQLPLSIGLVLILTKMDEFLSKFVPSTEEWTLVIMLIPLTILGIYISLFSSNLHGNKDKTICGEPYPKIKSKYITNSWILNTFKYNTLTATIGFVMYIITSDYPMIIGSGLVLSLDLFIFVLLEMYFNQKSTAELYQREFDIFFKSIEEILYFSQDELANIETMIQKGDWSGVNNLLSSKFDMSEYIDEMCYEFADYPPTLSRDISIRFAKTFSFTPKLIENNLLYKKHIDNVLLLSNNARGTGDDRGADELLISMSESWVQNVLKFLPFARKNFKKYNGRIGKTPDSFICFLEELQRFRILHNMFIEEHKIISDAINQTKYFERRKRDFENSSKLLIEALTTINNRHDDLLRFISENKQCSKESNAVS